MNWSSHPPFSSLTELVLGDSLFFPPIFKPVLLGFFFWLMIHPDRKSTRLNSVT